MWISASAICRSREPSGTPRQAEYNVFTGPVRFVFEVPLGSRDLLNEQKTLSPLAHDVA